MFAATMLAARFPANFGPRLRHRPIQTGPPVVAASKTHYEVLGVPSHASEQDIKSAFRKLALKLHPDVNKEARSQQRFMKAKAAYEVLCDGKSRAQYDIELQQGFSPGSWDVSEHSSSSGFDTNISSLEELLQYMGIMDMDDKEECDEDTWGMQEGIGGGTSFTLVINDIDGYSGVLPFLHMLVEDDDEFAGVSSSSRSSSRATGRSTGARKRQGSSTRSRATPNRGYVPDEDDPTALISAILENLPEREQRSFLRQLESVETEEELAWLVNKYQVATSPAYHAQEARLLQQLDDMFSKNHWRNAGAGRYPQGFQPDMSEMSNGHMGDIWEQPQSQESRRSPKGRRHSRRRGKS